MRVLGLCTYPVEAAATRFRMRQFVEPLRERDIELEIKPFLSSGQFRELYKKGRIAGKALSMIGPFARRVGQIFDLGQYDLIFIQREAMIFGPGMFESLYQTIGHLPIVLDLDDATYVRYLSPTYGRFGRCFKFFGKVDNLIKRADAVICGNRFVAAYVETLGTRAVVIPTVVDTEKFHPVEKHNEVPVVGWIGTHSTFPFLESIFPVLKRLAQTHKFLLRIVGAGREVSADGLEIENRDWNLEREIDDFQGLDIGLYPIVVTDSVSRELLQGKSGFKAIQYMAVGVPFVMSPIGVGGELVGKNICYFNAASDDDWYNTIDSLLRSAELRREMGMRGRCQSIGEFTISPQVDKLAGVFERVVAEFDERKSGCKDG
ncbi:MAG: glycosyltransferase family 4 protein [Pyrinomonadaceae bacterium]